MATSRKRTTAPHRDAVELVSASVEQTQALGEQIGRQLAAGDVVALHGELGSGKTTLIQGIARGLGRDAAAVKSPTFVLMRDYPGDPRVVHIDGYRLEGASSAAWLDVDLMFSPSSITLIEWAERFGDVLPPEHLAVHMTHASVNRRRVRVGGTGPRAAAVIAQLRLAMPAAPPPTDTESMPDAPRD